MTRRLFTTIVLLIVLFACGQGEKSDFTIELYEKLKFANDQFKSTNRAFILNVMTPGKNVIFQIVHRSYAIQTKHKNDSFGFALQLTFPPNIPDMEAYEKFKSWKQSSDFIHYKYDGISCYIIDLGEDIAKVQTIAESILIELYNLKKTDKIIFNLTDEGDVKNWL
jgi:hypothetical protein